VSGYWVPGDRPDLGFDASWVVCGGKRYDGTGVRLIASTEVRKILLTVDWDTEEELYRAYTELIMNSPVMKIETEIRQFVVIDAPTFAEAWTKLDEWSRQQDPDADASAPRVALPSGTKELEG
jgi:hypothetical protein